MIQGMQGLLDSMEALPYSLQKNLIVRELRKGGQVIADEAARIAPRDDNDDDGFHMADSMMVVVSDQTFEGAVAKIGPSRKGYYGIFTEIGTIYVAGKHWLRRAFDSRIEEVTRTIGEGLGRAIEKEMKRL